MAVRLFDRDAEGNIDRLQKMLADGTYHTSEGHECVRHCPCGKDRVLHKLPFYPDHIEHHALMQVLMPTLEKNLYADSSASVKGKGIHYAAKLTGSETERLEALNATVYETQKELEAYLYNKQQEEQQ